MVEADVIYNTLDRDRLLWVCYNFPSGRWAGMILVTGATGFIGRHLVQRLADNGYPVRVLLPANSRAIKASWAGKVPIVHGSIHNPESLHQAMNGIHTVFHMA